MAQTRTLQRRIRSVKNAGQITKALEVVAASRMRRTLTYVESSRRYGELAAEIMARIAGNDEARISRYFSPGSSKRKLYLIFTSDRGQAGAFNSNIFNAVNRAATEDRAKGLAIDIIVYGRKGTHHFSRISDFNMVAAYEDVPELPEVDYFASTLEAINNGFTEGIYSGIDMFYTGFISSLSQQAEQIQLLPVEQSTLDEAAAEKTQTVFEFEPELDSVLEEAIRIYLEARIMQGRIESTVSENAMRMIAMGNANRNAGELADSLTLEMNTLRQAAITQEIAEITGGAEAMAV